MICYTDCRGTRCHYCGEHVPPPYSKTGNHIFCHNGGKCRQAHYRGQRASKRRKKPVTSADLAARGQGDVCSAKSNAKRSDHALTSSPAIPKSRLSKRNAKRRHK